jgi:hypothetical protein
MRRRPERGGPDLACSHRCWAAPAMSVSLRRSATALVGDSCPVSTSFSSPSAMKSDGCWLKPFTNFAAECDYSATIADAGCCTFVQRKRVIWRAYA